MKRIFSTLCLALLSLTALADEGMWLLPLLKQQKFAEMQALGLRLSDQEVYSAEAPSLKDGVVRWRWLYGRDDLSGWVGADESSLWL